MIVKRILDYVKDCNNFLTFPISLQLGLKPVGTSIAT
jgi:hypothetical protein